MLWSKKTKIWYLGAMGKILLDKHGVAKNIEWLGSCLPTNILIGLNPAGAMFI